MKGEKEELEELVGEVRLLKCGDIKGWGNSLAKERLVGGRKYKYWERGGKGKGGRIEELEMLGNLLVKEG